VLAGGGAALQQDLAYAAMVEALRPLVRDASLVDSLPDLGRLFAELSGPAAPALDDAGLERIRLFESVCRLLERAASRRPLALLVDDVHWADRDSLALLQYLVRGLATHRLLVVLTYRADEAGGPLSELLGGLRRAGEVTPSASMPGPAHDHQYADDEQPTFLAEPAAHGHSITLYADAPLPVSVHPCWQRRQDSRGRQSTFASSAGDS
jgi:hypothetical protein